MIKLKIVFFLGVQIVWIGLQAQHQPKAKGELITHTYYSLDYSEGHEQAAWVYYILTSEMTKGTTERTNNFKEDKTVSTGSAQLIDYKGSGYDRGHLCPVGDMTINKIAMNESFYLSNITPQNPSFNRGGWKKLESKFRAIALTYDSTFIITGGILNDISQSIGVNKVSIPKMYYKVAYISKQGVMVAYIMPNEKIIQPLEEYQTTVDKVEQLTGYDFFSSIPEPKQSEMESIIQILESTF